ncbi:MAG: DUF58 domain-containing protein [Actinomycetota bacterium]|nr:DUF58 domain-containing protein [Actinomycetota bacterium]
MRRRISRRALTIMGAAGLLFIAASTAQAGWLFVLAAGVLALVVASLFTRQNLASAVIERSAPRRISVGDEVRVGLRVSNPGRRSLPLMRLEDDFGAFEPSVVAVERLRKGATAHIELVKRAHRRGVFDWGQVTLRSGAPFGFATSSRSVTVATQTTVVPRYVDLRSFPILEPSSSPSDVLHERARTGAGQEYIGVREYRPGDPRRAVHWRSTARLGRLVVREFAEEVQTRIGLVLAGGDVGTPPDSAFEMLVGAAASIGIYSLHTGHPIDALRATPSGEIAHLAEADRFGLLDWLAGAEPSDVALTPVVKQALGRVGRRGTVVLLAPTTGAAGADIADAVRAVQNAGSRAIVVAALGATWAQDDGATTEENGVLQALAGGRAPVMRIARGQELAACLG